MAMNLPRRSESSKRGMESQRETDSLFVDILQMLVYVSSHFINWFLNISSIFILDTDVEKKCFENGMDDVCAKNMEFKAL